MYDGGWTVRGLQSLCVEFFCILKYIPTEVGQLRFDLTIMNSPQQTSASVLRNQLSKSVSIALYSI